MVSIRRSVPPLPLWKALVLFAGTSIPIYLAVYYGIPVLQARGLTFLTSYLICFYPTFVAIFILALVLYWREGNPLTWEAFRSRYRLSSLKGRAWLWTIALLAFGISASLLLSPTARWLASLPIFAPPSHLPPELNPLKAAVPNTFMATTVTGTWGYALAYLLGWLFNILGEELLWRGFMLPRQEVIYGRSAWLVHGLLWTAWHIFWKWNLLSLLPITLGLPFVVQRTKNTSIGIVAHGLANLIPLFALVYFIAS
jgi:membrane protease YdiL (CAAX protease family)